MGQIFDRLGRFIKAERNSTDTNFSGIFNDDDAELKRIIDELNSNNARNASGDFSGNSQKKEEPKQSAGANMDMLKAYSILGIDESANPNEIKSAYFTKVKEYHPDKVATLGEELKTLAERKTQEINSAYNFLKQQKGF